MRGIFGIGAVGLALSAFNQLQASGTGPAFWAAAAVGACCAIAAFSPECGSYKEGIDDV